MTSNHLLSASLFAELFQHNIVSSNGRIIADENQLRNYSTFLIQQSKDRVVSLYEERKNLLKDAEELMDLEFRTKDEDKLLERLLDELDLKYDENYLLTVKEPKIQRKRYLGPEKPLKNAFERKIEAELQRVKVLKRDLKILDEWLDEISHLSAKIGDDHTDWKKAEKRFRERTSKRMCDMDKARMKLIKSYYKSHDKTLKKLLNPKQPTKDKHADKKSAPTSLEENEEQKSLTVKRSEEVGGSPSKNGIRNDNSSEASDGNTDKTNDAS